MLLDHYVSAMPCWKGRVDSDSDYDAFRWHQWVQPLDLNDGGAPFDGALGFAFVGFCSDKGVARNKGRTGTALAPDFVRGQMSNLPCTFSQEVKLFDAGDIVCDEISLEEGQRELGLAVEEILRRRLFPIVLGGGDETTFGHFQGQHNYLKDKGRTPELGIVNFDAHFDLRPYDMGNSSGTMFRQMADVCKAEGTPYHYFPIGIQQHSNTVSLFKKARELGVDYVLAKEIQGSNMESILERMDTFLTTAATPTSPSARTCSPRPSRPASARRSRWDSIPRSCCRCSSTFCARARSAASISARYPLASIRTTPPPTSARSSSSRSSTRSAA